jgi:hypothetical protein
MTDEETKLRVRAIQLFLKFPITPDVAELVVKRVADLRSKCRDKAS